MIKRIFLYLFILICVTGCYNYRELNDMAIVSGVSVSLSDNGYEVSVEVINPKRQQDAAGSEEPDFIIYKGCDTSIQEALRKITTLSPKKLYLSHIGVLIIDESVAKKNLPNILDYFLRNPEIRGQFYVLVGKSSDVLSITTPLENISSDNILNSLKTNAKDLGYANLVTFHDLVSEYLNPYQEIALPVVDIYGDKSKGNSVDNIKSTERGAYSVVSGIAIFKDNHFVHYLEGEDALIYNIVHGNAKNFLIKVNDKNDNFFVCEVLQEETDISVHKDKRVTISITGRAIIGENFTTYHLEDANVIESFEKKLNLSLQDMVEDSVSKNIRQFHTDVYGFQLHFYQRYPSFIQNLKRNWNDSVLDKLNIYVKSNIKLVEKGNLNGGITHE